MKRNLLLIVLTLFCLTNLYAQQQMTLNPVKDNTIYLPATGDAELSNGVGDYLFAGLAGNQTTQRALLKFDMTQLPTDIQIDSVALVLTESTPNAQNNAGDNINVYELTEDWGEGTSDALRGEGGGIAATTGDASWTYAFFDNDTWSTPGGTYNSTALVTMNTDMFDGTTAPFSSSLLTDLVSEWYSGEKQNNGLILVGDEASGGSVRFNSVQNDIGKPELRVFYTIISGLFDPSMANEQLEAYPNPTTGLITVNTDNVSASDIIEIVNHSGEVIRKISGSSLLATNGNIDLQGLARGMYIVNLISAETKRTAKILIEN